MLSFKKYVELNQFILSLAEEVFSSPLLEYIRPEEIYYTKDTQFISMSGHALKDGKERDRLWWNDEHHLEDPNFLKFADKVLYRLKNYDKLSPVGKYDIEKPDPRLDTKIGVCDSKEMKGWVIALQESKDKAFDSCHVVTILNKNVKSMNPAIDLFAKKDVYIDNIDKPLPQVTSQEDIIKKELNDIKIKLKDLESKHDDMYLDYEYEEDPKLKSKKKKEYDSIVRQIEQLKNRKNKLAPELKESVTIYTIVEKSTGQKIKIILV